MEDNVHADNIDYFVPHFFLESTLQVISAYADYSCYRPVEAYRLA